MGPIVEYAQLYVFIRKRCVDFHKYVSYRACQKYVSMDLLQNIQKAREFGEYADVPRNYSVSKLKLYQNLTSAQEKTRFPSYIDNSLESKRKIL